MTLLNDIPLNPYRYSDNVFTFEGSISVQEESEWVSPWRIKYEQAEFYPFLFDQVVNKEWSAPGGVNAAGVRLSFTTDAVNVVLELFEPDAGLKLELYVNGAFAETLTLEKGAQFASFRKLKGELKQVEIWLDQRHAFRLKRLLINESARVFKTRQTKQRWVHYGSSISHSRQASSPSGIWTAIVARTLNLHLTNLGFGANCVMEPMLGRLIRDLPADYITLKLGINVHNGRLTKRTFGPSVIGLIQLIREKHPETPLALISPIYSPPRETHRTTEESLTLTEMRECHAKIVEICKQYGDRNIYYVDGLKIFGPEELKYLPDELHPNTAGQPVLAERFIYEVFNRFPL